MALRLFLTLAFLAARPLWADAALCDHAAVTAARAHDVPLDVMRAITRTETGRPVDGALQPWPWTVNMEGAGHWFDTRAEAVAFARRHHDRGARSYDVGCFQLNWRWHGEAFASLDQMFEPQANADYAARYLRQHYERFGDWTEAAGRYHSGTPVHAERYATRFDDIRGGLSDAPPTPPGPQRAASLLRAADGPLLTAARGPLLGR